jgi:hypothetical protein
VNDTPVDIGYHSRPGNEGITPSDLNGSSGMPPLSKGIGLAGLGAFALVIF